MNIGKEQVIKMRTYKEIKKKVDTVDKIVCDLCGKDIKIYENSTALDPWFEGGQMSILFGYCSKNDGDLYQLDICDNCFDDWAEKNEWLKKLKEEKDGE